MVNSMGNETTPKILAQDILMDAVRAKMEFFNEDIEMDHLTDKEKKQVIKQAIRQYNRIAKLFGYEPLKVEGK